MRQKNLRLFARQGILLMLSTALVACGSSSSKPGSSSSTISSSSSSSSSIISSSSSSSEASSSSSVAEPSLVLAINSGSFLTAAYNGIEYQADQFSTGGTANSTADPITGDIEGTLFKTERYGSYKYEVPVTEGTYSVNLHFVDMYQTRAGARSFNLLVEDQTVLTAFDLFAEVGHDTAYSLAVNNISVTDGHLTISLESLIDNGTLSGFAIYSSNGEFVPPPPPEPGTPGEPGVASAENNGADCPVPILPAVGQLPVIAKLPDPFVNAAGERITTTEEWRCLRQETNLKLQHYEAGTKPAKPEVVAGTVTNQAITVNVEHEGEQISFTASVTLPSVGTAPYPAMIGVGGSNLDNAYLASKGIAVINFNNNQVGAQAGGNSRGTGLFFDLYGSDHSASSMTAWAWGVSRLIDVIDSGQGEIIDPTRLGVTGCSRNGKGALMAGALDERIALTIPQESGAGGAVSWRVAQSLVDGGENIQTLSHAAGEQPWFRASFGDTFGGANVTRLPYDHHQLMGMVAPRGLLVLDNTVDWLGPVPAFVATSATKEIYRALGAPDNVAYSEVGGHNHCQFPGNQLDVLSAFVQRFLLGEAGNTNVMRSTLGDADDVSAWVDWTTPPLQ
jgi:hypothetical protein